MHWKRIISHGISDISEIAHVLKNSVPRYRVLMYHAVDGEVVGDRLKIFGEKNGSFSTWIYNLANLKVSLI